MSGRFLSKLSVAKLRCVCTFFVGFTCHLTICDTVGKSQKCHFSRESVVLGKHCQACRREGVTSENEICSFPSFLHTLLPFLSSEKAGRVKVWVSRKRKSPFLCVFSSFSYRKSNSLMMENIPEKRFYSPTYA